MGRTPGHLFRAINRPATKASIPPGSTYEVHRRFATIAKPLHKLSEAVWKEVHRRRLSCNHTCWFELFTCLLRWDMIAQKTFLMVTHTKFTKVPTLTPPFLCCDVNADKVHYPRQNVRYPVEFHGHKQVYGFTRLKAVIERQETGSFLNKIGETKG